jgi:hypothetical protein
MPVYERIWAERWAHLQNPVFGDKQKKANIAVNTRRLITAFHLPLTAANPFPKRDWGWKDVLSPSFRSFHPHPPVFSSSVNRWNEATAGGRSPYPPQARLGNGFAAVGERWKVVIKSSWEGSRSSKNRLSTRWKGIYLLKKLCRWLQ